MRTEVPASRPIRVVGRFSEDRRANVAIIFALALIPIVGCVGAGIDYGHAISVRTALQAALDFDRADAVEIGCHIKQQSVAEHGPELL